MNATPSSAAAPVTETATGSAYVPNRPESGTQGRSACGPVTVPPNAGSLSAKTARTGANTSSDISSSLSPPSPIKARRLTLFIGAGVLLGLFAYAGFQYLRVTRSRVKTDNAYLAAHIHTISSRVAGTVKEVLVDENQSVTAGMVLARLDSADFDVRRQQALAQASEAHARIQQCAAQIEQARTQIAREQAQAIKASNDLARAGSLYEGGSGAISRQEFDLARAEADAAAAALEGTRAALDSAIAAASAATAQQQVAAAGLHDAELQLSYTEILAPAAGRIGKKNLEVGNRVQPGQPLLALVQPELWVNANFKETQLANLRAGQAVRVWIDAFPGRTFRGNVEGLSPGSGAQFALLPPDNATGNFTKIVQRVPVKITLDRASLGDFEGRLAAGMSALVEVRLK